MNVLRGSKQIIFSLHFEGAKPATEVAEPDRIGVKAAGLLRLPTSWTPPFFVIPTNFHDAWLEARPKRGKKLFSLFLSIQEKLPGWIEQVSNNGQFKLVLRSSAENETLEERGQYKSKVCEPDLNFQSFCEGICEIYVQALNVIPIVRIAIVVQRYVSSEVVGHFSNETHLMPTRDRWLIEYSSDREEIKLGINSRKATAAVISQQLKCANPKQIQPLMRTIGKWGTENFTERLHFEWVLSAGCLWLVQLDPEGEDNVGENPKSLINVNRPKFRPSDKQKLSFFTKFVPGKKPRWQKLKNIEDFNVDDEPPKNRLYFATGSTLGMVIGNKKKFRALINEITRLTGDAVVIRTDVKTGNKGHPIHNLPRTDTVNPEEGTKWIRETLKSLRKSGNSDKDICFILHRYIQAVASAWAFCEPGGNIVHIDSLWGLPDGLQFCPHDSFEVDLRVRKVPSKRIRFKPYFLREQCDGNWEYVRVNRKFGRHSSLSDKSLVYIAEQTRKVADKIREPAQIMWFCNIPVEEELGEHIPWFRTTHFSDRQQHEKRHGRTIEIRSRDDLKRLEGQDYRNLGLRVFPSIELVRDETFTDEIIIFAQSFGMPVEIGGSVLGHAFYKFQNAGLVVHTSEPSRKYERVRELHVYDKLVRDGIPEKIESGGEQVVQAKLTSSQIKAALAAKLIEELFELIEARNADAQELELADIIEVTRSLIKHLGFNFEHVWKVAGGKRREKGSFEEGRFLIQTSLPKAEHDDFVTQLESPRIGPVKLGAIRSAKSKIIIPFTALTIGDNKVVTRIGNLKSGLILTIEVTKEGLRVGVEQEEKVPAPDMEQLELPI